MLILIWEKFKGGIIIALSILAALGGVYIKGRQDKAAETEAAQSKKRLEDLKKVGEVNEKVEKLDDAQLDRSLNKWMRD